MKKVMILILITICSFSIQDLKVSANSSDKLYEQEISNSSDQWKVDPNFDVVMEKQKIVEKYGKGYMTLFEDELEQRDLKILDIMSSKNQNKDESKKKLEAIGIILMEIPYISQASQPSDVTLNAATVAYDYYLGQWIVGGSGYWNNDEGCDDEHPIFGCSNYLNYTHVGHEFNVGGRDAVGVHLADTYGTFDGTYVISSYGKFYNYDGAYNIYEYNYNRDQTSSQYGASFTIQDYTEITDYGFFTMEEMYVAQNFMCLIRYNSTFVNYNGNASSFYVHTWANTEINSIGLGKDSFSVSFSSSSDRWYGQSTGDTPF